MWHVGLDAHTKRSTFCVLDENGKKMRTQTVRGLWDKVLRELAKIKRPFAVCFEASTGYGVLYDRLRRIAKRVLVAHPGHLRLIFRSKRKNDRVDAEKLAKLLFLDEAPPVHVPSRDVRAWRSMIEHRRRTGDERARAKNSVQAPASALGSHACVALSSGPASGVYASAWPIAIGRTSEEAKDATLTRRGKRAPGTSPSEQPKPSGALSGALRTKPELDGRGMRDRTPVQRMATYKPSI